MHERGIDCDPILCLSAPLADRNAQAAIYEQMRNLCLSAPLADRNGKCA